MNRESKKLVEAIDLTFITPKMDYSAENGAVTVLLAKARPRSGRMYLRFDNRPATLHAVSVDSPRR